MKNPLTALPDRLRRRMPNVLRTMAEMENEVDRWLQHSINWPEEVGNLDFVPICNFRDTGKSYVVQFDIPGVKKDAIKVEIENNQLSISGERRELKENKEARNLLSECYYGSFLRSFSLPSAVDETKVDAHYEDGVLTIEIPKLETGKSKEVKIH